ncbi:Crp/Fnr family transcriptional regulator [Thermosipho melanesiensis]|uniref:Crp/Fnr family transcriptional regulator n=2 Tax=Thermosipho melanesiensis TaxID=46541 RepID=A0ABM6GE59_9BACT|nr:Crp/Fnr family transcriptional regulator [Thermosipho melanesiensis]ABR30619.1 putative transcriptional regulator, Crp/Fnr family [Thermosipho melanesiensis BI429]APT73759.1 Crp/Fnr family transcriptional regulator [Thermosipho melanesiensis]OOC35699.1 Crp/Fnr family transcriptional regulator [Thermosipho melanesiensis]OOC38998.1 Crp/Fnr family transcriptional regulator [Thermosipho melanesiensis]OOC39146.1 Crp/Fnr family transcriptional regulator [Thermosipho melanesiensis]
MHPIIDKFSKIEVFKKLKIVELEELFKNRDIIFEEYEEGVLIKSQGEVIDEIMILINGKVKAEMTDYNGKSLMVEEIDAPNFLAINITFSKEEKLPVDIITLKKSLVAYMKKDKVFDLAMKNREFLKALVEYLGSKFYFISQKLWFVTLNSLKDKILIYLSSKFDGREVVILDKTIEQLSQLFGSTRPALSRAFSQLEKEGIIKKEGNKVYLLDKDFFEK